MILCVLILFLFLEAVEVKAATFEITGQPESIDAATSFEISYSFNCSSCDKKINYFFGAFKAVDSDYHFGFNLVNDEWIDYESTKDFAKFSQASPSAEGVWSGKLKVKAIDLNLISNHFKGKGQYILRVMRYTPNTTSNKAESSINLLFTPPPTPTPTPEPTHEPTPLPTSTPSPIPEPSPTPQITPTTTKSPQKPTQRTLSASHSFELVDLSTASVAGMTNDTDPGMDLKKDSKPNSYIPYIFVAGGMLIFSGAIPAGIKFLKESKA